MRVFKKCIILLIAAVMILSAAGCGIAPASSTTSRNGIIISEVVSSNSNSLIDPVFGRPDWIEIGNFSDKAIDLADYSVSTAKSSDKACALPHITLESGKFILLFCSNPLENMPKDKYCTGFKLSKTGITLILSYKESIIQRLDVPQLETDISYGVTADGAYKYFSEATPGLENTTNPYLTLAELESKKAAQLRVTEVMPNSDTEPYGWVEICNAGNNDLKLSDYYMTEDFSNPTKCRLPDKTLKAGEYAVLKFTGGTGADELAFKIGGPEASLMISNNFGASVDTFSWDPAVLPGISAGRSDDTTAVYFEKPTPGKPNGNDALAKVDFTINEGSLPVRINEILKDNSVSITDADGDRSAWVELYNTTDQKISLSQYALTDDKEDLWKFILPDTEIAPKGYFIVYLSGKDRRTGDQIHAGFKLGSTDKELVLTCKEKRAKQTVTLPEKSRDNVSYGLDDSGGWVFFPSPTPEGANTTAAFKDILSIQDTVSALRINEVMGANTVKGKNNDWVELYNSSPQEIDLKGYFLSDTEKNLKKWPVVQGKAPAKGYAVINGDKSGYLSISSSGERLFLSDPQGALLDQYETGLLKPGISSGLAGDRELKRVFFKGGTKLSANTGTSLQGYAREPVFSEQGGYKDAAFSLEMKTAAHNAQIYYTLDGSTPTAGSTKYSGPVSISGTKTVRAITVAPGLIDSDETVATYILGIKHKLPVVCLSMTQSDFTFVCGSPDRDHKREKAGYVEYYEADGKLGVRFPAGFSIAGNGTRSMAQKSINLYLRGMYGRSSVTYPFFENYKITTFKSLSLRNMGQDADSRMKDLYSGMVVNGMNIDNMQGKFAVVYVNGKYWGLYEFKENQNEDYFASRYGVDPNKLDMIRGGVYAITGTNKDVKDMYKMSGKNTNDPGIFKQYSERADSALTMDYIIAQTYLYGVDKYNQKLARSQDYKMKWHPLFYDLDMTMGNVSGDAFGIYFTSGESYGPLHEDGTRQRIYMELYNGFYKNDEWKKRFVERYAEVMNTVLTPEKMLALFNSMVDSIKDEMPHTIDKWKNPSSMSSWNGEIKKIRDFIQTRRKYVINQLQDEFHLSDARVKELFPNG